MKPCNYCATALPSDALFCGECGRAVSKSTSRAAGAGLPTLAAPVPQLEPWMNASAGDVCQQCGFPVMPDDIFCGECGFVVPAFTPLSPRSNDTNVIQRLEQVNVDKPEEKLTEAVVQNLPEPGPELPRAAAPVDQGALSDDVESTRIVSPPLNGERFVLQFSTGESFTVFGSGLVGRSPRAEPSEYFDHMVRIIDASRSVSKTHLEFGQEAGSFWVKDRYSGNGTIVREPDSEPVRCHPERRYLLVRGSRVDVGEQFFIVS